MNDSHTASRSRDTAIVLGALAIFGAEIGVEVTRQLSPSELSNYLIQLFATFIGASLAAIFGLILFDYQTRENDKRRSQQLKEALLGELQGTLDTLEAEPQATIYPPESSEEESVIFSLSRLEPVVCEEATCNAVYNPSETLALSHIARAIHLYDRAVQRFNSIRWGPAVTNQASLNFEAAKVVAYQQEGLIEACKLNIEEMSKEGMALPARYFSKASEEKSEAPTKPDG